MLYFILIFKVVELKRVLLPKSREEFEDVYMVTDLLEADLAQVIKSEQNLLDDHMQLFIYQILRGLKYLHTAGILHRDLVFKTYNSRNQEISY